MRPHPTVTFLSMTTRIALTLLLALALISHELRAADAPAWENISDALFQKLDVMEVIGKNGKPQTWMRRTQGLAVDPVTGHIFLHIAARDAGLHISKDHGATWAKLGDNQITGRGECGFSLNLAYPFTGRMVMFTDDGVGGMTLDGGATWSRIERHRRAFDYGDVDWSSAQPQLMFALNHEPFGRCVSTDAGKTWTHSTTTPAATRPTPPGADSVSACSTRARSSAGTSRAPAFR